MKKRLSNAKFIINIESDKNTKKIKTISIFDNRIEKYLDNSFIKDRGIEYFLNIEDLKETLNWNLNGDSSKYKLKWGQSCKATSQGLAYIFD